MRMLSASDLRENWYDIGDNWRIFNYLYVTEVVTQLNYW